MRAAPSSGGASAAPLCVLLHHPRFGAAPIRATRWPRPDEDEAATGQTIERMQEFIAADATHPLVMAAAQEAIAGLAPNDAAGRVRAVFNWIKRRILLVTDAELAGLGGFLQAEDAEVLIRPVDLLGMPQPQGDCDDFAMLGAAMLRALGISSELITIAADPADRSRYSHVYLLAILPCGRRVPLDLSHGPYPGWQPASLGKTRIWVNQRPGLGAINWGSLLQIGAETGAKIATARYAQPPAGTYIQSGPSGQVIYRQPEDATAFQFPTTQLSGGLSGWITAGLLVIALLVFARVLKS